MSKIILGGSTGNKKFMVSIVKELLPSSIFDVGAGDASAMKVVRKALKNNECYIEGIEVDEAAPELDPYVGIYDKMNYEDITKFDYKRTYDLGCMFDVIEHFPYEIARKVLMELKMHCKNVVITIPSVNRCFNSKGLARHYWVPTDDIVNSWDPIKVIKQDNDWKHWCILL